MLEPVLTRAEGLDTLRRLWRHPRRSRDELLAFQDRRLRSAVSHAYARVPCYRARFDAAGVHPGDIRSAADLAALPVTRKRDLRAERLERILARGVDPARLVAHHTSGSTGEPFTIRRTPFEDWLAAQFRLRARRAWGIGPFDRIAYLAEIPRGAVPAKPLAGVRRALRLFPRQHIDALRPVEEILGELDRFDPEVISGYPNVVAQVGSLAAQRASPGPSPRVVYTGAEPLTPVLRRRIGSSFGARVFDAYGAHEFSLLAWECPERSGELHVCEDNVVLEVLHDGRPAAEGERGEVVVTALHARAMPFLRYATGDVAERGAEQCPCGQPFATLRSVQGRTSDYFRLPGGRIIHPFEIGSSILEPEEGWIDQFQLVQESEARIALRIAALRPPEAGALERVERLAQSVVGPDVRVVAELVPGFSVQGKFRSYRSLESPEESE
jgi:phenylacetate-CoA ligase